MHLVKIRTEVWCPILRDCHFQVLSTQDPEVNHRPALSSPQAGIGQEVEASPKRLVGPGGRRLRGDIWAELGEEWA